MSPDEHTSHDGGRSPRTVARFAFGLAVGLALALTSGCNRVDSEGDAATLAEDAGAPIADAPFAWPDDASHPRLRVAVEGGAVRGTIEIELMPELAPSSVPEIIDLAKDGYYDGTTFHRVIPGFMIQGGDPNSRDRDPTNDGYGDPDVRLDDEFGDAPFVRGVVGLANLGRAGSTGGQLFIMLDERREFEGRYTVIGRVSDGMDVVDAIAGVEVDRTGRWGPRDRPIENVVLAAVTVAPPDAPTADPPPAHPRPQGSKAAESLD